MLLVSVKESSKKLKLHAASNAKRSIHLASYMGSVMRLRSARLTERLQAEQKPTRTVQRKPRWKSLHV